MAGKTWETDFRRAAVHESIRRIGDARPDDLFDCPGSFCVPVGHKPIVGWTPGWFMLVGLVLGFLLLITAAGLGALAEKTGKEPAHSALTVASVVSLLSGFSLFFLPLKCDRQIVRRLIGDRGRALEERADRTPILVAEVVNGAESSMKISINGDDYAFILPDEANRRVLIEGIGARYQIRADDVERLGPFQFMNYVGVEIVYRIGPEVRLHLAIARTSLMAELIRQVPILFFLRSRVQNQLLDRIARALEPGDESGNGGG